MYFWGLDTEWHKKCKWTQRATRNNPHSPLTIHIYICTYICYVHHTVHTLCVHIYVYLGMKKLFSSMFAIIHEQHAALYSLHGVYALLFLTNLGFMVRIRPAIHLSPFSLWSQSSFELRCIDYSKCICPIGSTSITIYNHLHTYVLLVYLWYAILVIRFNCGSHCLNFCNLCCEFFLEYTDVQYILCTGAEKIGSAE
jgi:hypothetical protein